MEYRIITADTIAGLECKVNEATKQGFKPILNLSFRTWNDDVYYFQPMLKEEGNPEAEQGALFYAQLATATGQIKQMREGIKKCKCEWESPCPMEQILTDRKME